MVEKFMEKFQELREDYKVTKILVKISFFGIFTV